MSVVEGPAPMRTVIVGDTDFERGEVVRLVFPAGYKRNHSARVQQRRRSAYQLFVLLLTFIIFSTFVVVWL